MLPGAAAPAIRCGAQMQETGRPAVGASAAADARPITRSGSPIRRPGEKELCGGGADGHEIEPIYGADLPAAEVQDGDRLADDNCVDVLRQRPGLVADRAKAGGIVGYNVLVGGGMGVTPSNKKTFPALAQRLAFIQPEQVVDVATAIIKVQRDFGNRSDRKRARLKYLIADWGLRLVQGQGRRVLRPLAGRAASARTSSASTTTSAGTSRATAAGSTA